MKVTRTLLLWITAGLGFFLIAYTLFGHFSGIRLNEPFEKYLLNGIIFAALGVFVYNRKLAADEKKAREAKERGERDTE
jgi:putative Mn2+ efflux pump MntP